MSSMPTWLMVRLCRPFLPRAHPWRERRFTLAEWREGQTDFCQFLDLVLWCHLAGAAAAAGAILVSGLVAGAW